MCVAQHKFKPFSFSGFEQLTESKVFIRNELAFDMNSFKDRIKSCEPSTTDKRLEKKLEKVYTSFKGIC